MTLRHEPDVSHADWFVHGGDDWRQLCSIGPSGFAAYARVMHPIDEDLNHGRFLCAEGDPGADIASALGRVLSSHTRTADDCFFGLWEGFGNIHETVVTTIAVERGSHHWTAPPLLDEAVREGPRVKIPLRSYLLFRGHLEDSGRWPTTRDEHINDPNLIWPADHAWFVASEIDLPWTGVGGSVELIESLLSDETLDVVPATASPDLPYWRE